MSIPEALLNSQDSVLVDVLRSTRTVKRGTVGRYGIHLYGRSGMLTGGL